MQLPIFSRTGSQESLRTHHSVSETRVLIQKLWKLPACHFFFSRGNFSSAEWLNKEQHVLLKDTMCVLLPRANILLVGMNLIFNIWKEY